MSFWLSYVGIGFAGRAIPYFDDSHTLLFSAPVVVATLLLPAAALSGFVWTRRWRYGPFFLRLALVAVLVIMGAGFPEGTPLRHGLTFTYNHVAAVRFLRASYKAAPLLAISLGMPGRRRRERGSVWSRATSRRCGRPAARSRRRRARRWRPGRSSPAGRRTRRCPTRRSRQHGSRSPLTSTAGCRRIRARSCCPGDLFWFYTWGGTVDPILPGAEPPAGGRAHRGPVCGPAGDRPAVDDRRPRPSAAAAPGSAARRCWPLIGVRRLSPATDDDLARSDAPPPADVAAAASAPARLRSPSRRYGPLTDVRADRARAAGEPARRSGATTSPRRAGSSGSSHGRPRDARWVRRSESPGWPRSAASPEVERCCTRRSHRRRLRAAVARRRRGRDQRLQSPPGVRRRVARAEHRTDADRRSRTSARTGSCSTRSGARPDYETVAVYAGIRSGPGAVLAGASRNSPSTRRSPRSTGLDADGVACRSDAGARPPLARGRPQPPDRRPVRRPAAVRRRWRRRQAASRLGAKRSRCGPAGIACALASTGSRACV